MTSPRRMAFVDFFVRPLRLLQEHACPSGASWAHRARRRHAQRTLARQLDHQAQRAAALRGREDEVVAALAQRWDRVQHRLQRFAPGWDDPRLLEVGSGAHGIVFGSGSTRAVGVDPLAVQYAGLFPAWQQRVRTVAASGEGLPFGDAAFDVVFCVDVVDHAERPAAVVAELARVLVPGGLLYLSVNVHHRLYSLVAKAHQAWNVAGIPLEIGAFAGRTALLTPDEAHDLFIGLPLEVHREKAYRAEAKERARHRRFRHPGHLVPLLFFKDARFEVIASRR